jgi:hypothetical protein
MLSGVPPPVDPPPLLRRGSPGAPEPGVGANCAAVRPPLEMGAAAGVIYEDDDEDVDFV